MPATGCKEGPLCGQCACRMVQALPEEEFGRNVAFREYSLLDNPRAGIMEGDVLTGHVCQVPPPLICCAVLCHLTEGR